MPLRFLITALSFGLASLAVQAQVVADPQAPAGQRPTVLRSANGVTQVNVQTPSAAGVSRNTYRQFDVPAQGVILNNSRTDTPTELGGWVQGNPWLARGPARILLNEVVSADPSRLAGRVEVAGQRAEVVIANPSGITCSGCGFLNASRATLTTGTPVLVDGALQGYRVQGGHLEIGGSGLDARGTDYAALIARAVRFNANVWARHLAVVAGANEVAASVAADAPPSSTPLPGTGPAPRVLIDVSALGGLYAGKIYLVGTEAGLGVVQTGRILASDDLVLRTDGWLTQSGRLEAGKTLHLEAGGLDNNRGGIAAARVQVLADKVRNHAGVILSDEDLWIASRGKVDNGSGLMAAGRALQIDARELSVGRAGSVQSKGWLSVNAGSVDNADGGTFAGMSTRLMARDRFTNRGLVDGAYTRIDAGSIHNLGTGRLFGDRLSIGADTLTNDTETVGGVRADAVIAARERLDIGVRELTNREHALIFSAGTADDAMTIGGSLDAQGRATGQAEQVTNRSATIESMGGLSLHARRLDNSNAHFGTHIVQSLEPTQRAYIQPEGGAMLPAELFNWESWSRAGRYRYRSDPPTGAGAVLGQSPVPRVGEQACTGEDGQEVCTRLPGADYPAGDPAWAYFGQPAPAPEPAPPTLPEPVPPDASRAASCSSGGPPQDATTCEAYRTDLATYQAAHAVYTQAWADHTAQRQAWQADTDARYARLDGLIEAYNAGFAHRYIQNWTQYQVTRSERETRVLHSDPGRLLSGGDMHLAGGELVNDKSQIVSGGALTGDLANLRTVEAAGLRIVSESGTSQYTASRWRGGFRRYHQRDWGLVAPYAPADEVTSFVLPVAQRREHAGSLTGIASLPTLATRPGVIDPAGALSGLFQPTADTAAPYFIETDPRFTQRHPWQQIIQAQRGGQIDPDPQHKRLGDAFFEQQLIRDQVLRLTGQRFLAGYADDETQYQALLQAGTTLAQAHRLRPGVALTASQMAQLTTDVVWMVLTDVVLPDGRTVQALVPHLHVVNRPGLDAAGALLVGHSVDLRLSGDLVNEGTIAARADLAIEADNIHNLGGQLQADAVAAQARGDLLNRAGVIQAGRVLGVEAGRDLVIESTTHTQRAQDGLSSGERTHIDRLASLYVTGPGGTLLARAGRDLRMAGAHVVNRPSVPVQLAGATVIVAGRDLLLESVQESGSTRTVANAGNFSVHARQSDAGSRIDTQGDLTLAAGRDVRAVAATGSSQDGEVKVLAGRDLAWAAGRAREQRDEARQLTQRGTLSRTTTTTRHTLDDTAAVAGVLSGRTVSVQAGQDLRVTGSQVVSTDATRLAAGRDLTLDAVTQSRVSQSLRDERKSGVFSSGGVGVTLGVRQQTAEQDNAATTVAATTVGSTDGSVVITAGQAYRQVGSDVLAPEGDIAIGAGQVDIVEGRESSRTQVRTRSRQSGVTLAVSNPVISAAQTARQMADAASHTQDSRMQVLAAASTVLAVRSAAKALADPKGQPALAGGVNVNISLGRSHSESQTVQVTEQAVASSVVAGGSAVIRASGAGAASDLTVQGSTVQAE
ncbi:MAG: putative hemagglutination domain, partial [Pseudomonadota bacterium]